MSKGKNAIILCSGGLDSIVTSFYSRKKLNYKSITLLFFNYGQKSLIQERKYSKLCAKNIGAKFIEISLPELSNLSQSLINKPGKVKRLTKFDLKDTKKESKKWYVPNRNMIFISYALSLAESLGKTDILLGFKNEGRESYPDTTEEFVKSTNNLIKAMSIGNIKIIAPLIKMDKEDIILLGKRLGVNFKNTFSCYIGKEKHCGYCLACMLRKQGFYWANVTDPTSYKTKWDKKK